MRGKSLLKNSKNQLARLHAVWALGSSGKHYYEARLPLFDNIKDSDIEVKRAIVEQLGKFVTHSEVVDSTTPASHIQAGSPDV